NPTVRIHYTPTYSSWLNQVEIWFSKIQRDVIARGIFTSTTDLSRKLIRYIRQYNKTATPFRWRFKNADHRIKPVTQRASDSPPRYMKNRISINTNIYLRLLLRVPAICLLGFT